MIIRNLLSTLGMAGTLPAPALSPFSRPSPPRRGHLQDRMVSRALSALP
jgi:hypothetical protein